MLDKNVRRIPNSATRETFLFVLYSIIVRFWLSISYSKLTSERRWFGRLQAVQWSLSSGVSSTENWGTRSRSLVLSILCPFQVCQSICAQSFGEKSSKKLPIWYQGLTVGRGRETEQWREVLLLWWPRRLESKNDQGKLFCFIFQLKFGRWPKSDFWIIIKGILGPKFGHFTRFLSNFFLITRAWPWKWSLQNTISDFNENFKLIFFRCFRITFRGGEQFLNFWRIL